MIEIRSISLGPIQTHCYIVRQAGSDSVVVIDPGDEAPRVLAAIEELGVNVEAILLTHAHFDHTGAVAPVARATGAPVWCPEIERPVLADIMRFVPWPGFGPFESYEADHLLSGGEKLRLAGLTIDVIFAPGHSPGHLVFAIVSDDDPDVTPALLSGDILFQGSVGRTDLPGGDHARMLQSIAELLEAYPDDAVVYPGHMGLTTLGAERQSNPFLQALAQ